MVLHGGPGLAEWVGIHNRLTEWGLEMDQHPDLGLKQTLTDQIRECNLAFGKYIERNYRWNFTWNALDGATFFPGISFISVSVILPLYVSHFTSNPLVIGLISFISTAGTPIPQLFMANAVERAPLKIYFPKVIGFFLERTPMYLLAPTAYLLATSNPTLALVVFFILHTWHSFGAGTIYL